jgi:hypothetical protein
VVCIRWCKKFGVIKGLKIIWDFLDQKMNAFLNKHMKNQMVQKMFLGKHFKFVKIERECFG